MFLRFQRIALDVSYGFGRSRSMFLIVVLLIVKKKRLANVGDEILRLLRK